MGGGAPPVLPIYRKNEAPAAAHFPLSAGSSGPAFGLWCLLRPAGFTEFNRFHRSSQLRRDLFYEAVWDHG